MKLNVKNMVCRRCVMTVKDICCRLGLDDAVVTLGTIELGHEPESTTLDELRRLLIEVGFETLQSTAQVVTERIRAAIRSYARGGYDNKKLKLSEIVADAARLDFKSAARLFTSIDGRSVRDYLMSQRIEYVKELLNDGELTLASIADATGFSSVAHLSRAFKRSVGTTITDYRLTGSRKPLDEV